MTIHKHKIAIVLAGVCFIVLLLFLNGNFAPEEAIEIKRGVSQLFIDDYLIAQSTHLIRHLHQPRKDNDGNVPVIELTNEFSPYHATLEANGTIVFDPRLKKYVMFALGYSVEGKHRDNRENRWKYYRVYRFTSPDGLHWVKGDSGKAQWVFPRSRKDLYDPQSGTYATNVDVGSYYYDCSDPQYPYKGWRHFSNWGDDREGQYYLYSEDGIHWHRGPLVVNAYGGNEDPYYQTIHQNGFTLVGPQDVSIFYHDQQTGKFLAIFKFYSPRPVRFGNQLRSRVYAFLDQGIDHPVDIRKLTHITLLPPAKDSLDDTRFDEYYGSTGWRYESIWLGGLKIYHEQGDYPWSAAGCAFLKLIYSRDGIHWKKVTYSNDQGEIGVFIPNGPEGGNHGRNDGGYLTEFSNPPLRIGDELIFYYGCSSWGKNQPPERKMSGGGIFRARLRIDGFVSVDGGVLVTRLLRVEGAQHITVNASGPVVISLLDRYGNVIAHQKLEGDSLQHEVFQEISNLSRVLATGFHLRFRVLPGGHLYSFQAN